MAISHVILNVVPYNLDIHYCHIKSMNPDNSETDQYLRTMCQLQPEPEPEPNEPENHSGGEQVTDNEEPA
jgi:hypothetical protein